ncbi:MAG: hypothetical protein HN348_10560 [Proteobacteria bacterium]|nr:hypothetical protein [Pseudomonadota bacterium]
MLWSDRARFRFFLIPQGVLLTPGNELVVSYSGDTCCVDEAELGWYQISPRDAVAWTEARKRETAKSHTAGWNHLLSHMVGRPEEPDENGLVHLGQERLDDVRRYQERSQVRRQALTWCFDD